VSVTPPAVTYLQAEPIYIRAYATGLFFSLIIQAPVVTYAGSGQ
jgi:hypothetical protein